MPGETPADKSVRQSVFEAVQRDMNDPTSAFAKTLTATQETPSAQGEVPAPATVQAPPNGTAEAADPVPGAEAVAPEIGSAPPQSPPVSEAPPVEPGSASGEAPPPEAGGAASAASGAPAVPEYDEVAYEDPELGETIRVLAPKGMGARVKDGYALKAAMSRHATYLGRHKQLLEPLIANGQFEMLAPIIERINREPAFAQALGKAIQRYQAGLPMTFADEVQQSGAAVVPSQAGGNPAVSDVSETVEQTCLQLKQQLLTSGVDEYTAESVVTAQRPIIKRQAELEASIAAQRAAEQQRASEQQRYTQQQQQALQQVNWAISQGARDLALRYPQEFTGDPAQDEAKMNSLFNYAKQAGMVEVYGINPALFLVAKADLDAKRAGAPAQPVATAPPQPASTLAAQAQAVAGAAGAAIAQRTAATVINKGQAEPPPAKQPDPLKAIKTQGRSLKDISRDVVKVIERSAS